MEEQNTKRSGRDYLLPVSIIIAAVLISGSLLYNVGAKKDIPGNEEDLNNSPSLSEDVLNISQNDHVRGNSDASVKIIEYSDLECPFCKQFHVTMKRIIAEYGDRASWIYRHFPIPQLHPKAAKEAEASECAYDQGGNDAFWAYVDKLFEITPSNNGLDPALLPQIATDVGLDSKSFESCLSSGKYSSFVTDEAARSEDVMIATCPDPQGRCGTPYLLIVRDDGKWYPLSGAYPYETLKSIIDQMLTE